MEPEFNLVPALAQGLVIDELAHLPAGTLLDQQALAHVLHLSERTVRRMVFRHELPPGVKLGARRIWMSDKVLEHLRERGERAKEEAIAQARRLGRQF